MSQRVFVSASAFIGAAIPLVWLAVYWIFLRGNQNLIHSIMSDWRFDRVLVALWPSWLLLIADPEQRSVAIPVVAIAVNAVLYGLVGWLIWLGVIHGRLTLALVFLALIVGWYVFLRWYAGG